MTFDPMNPAASPAATRIPSPTGTGNPAANPTAAVLMIGNEILSGRTQDLNLAHIAKSLTARGIRLLEARVIPDIAQVIVDSINELRGRHSYLFTTGGIGPTHDDITADCVAEAFGVALPEHPDARARLLSYYQARDIEPNQDRLRMARIPEGALLIDNPVSAAPGFHIGNVYVFAGVPRIMQAMLESVLPELATGPVWHSISVTCNLGEGTIASSLRQLQARYPNLELGSYPGKTGELHRLSLVARGIDPDELQSVRTELQALITVLGGVVADVVD